MDYLERIGSALPKVIDHPSSAAPRAKIDNLWAKREAEIKRRNQNARRARIGFPPLDAA